MPSDEGNLSGASKLVWLSSSDLQNNEDFEDCSSLSSWEDSSDFDESDIDSPYVTDLTTLPSKDTSSCSIFSVLKQEDAKNIGFICQSSRETFSKSPKHSSMKPRKDENRKKHLPMRDTPGNPLLGSKIEKNKTMVTQNDFAQVFRGRRFPVPPNYYDYNDQDDYYKNSDIKPRNLLPLLLSEAAVSKSVVHTLSKGVDCNSENMENPFLTDESEAEEDSEDSSDRSRRKRITDYVKGSKRYHPHSKTAALRKKIRLD
ncbi:9871_t:CDS:1 [Acaulospora colombiana]|uniref:9871_t:CDS:1 n=1 Tax=Acaulospora colombiana TaxID=27376 RepID=A0ACA9MDL0_9GLOM|nr:9871_t:CDS:1 [Acaulospora colombiana]